MIATRFADEKTHSRLLRQYVSVEVASNNDIPKIKELVKSVKLSIDNIENADVWLIHRDATGEIIGCMGLEKRGSRVYIQSLSVDPRFRKQGIARALVGYGFARFLHHGDQLIALTLFWNKEFYEKLGFEKTDAKEIKRADDVGSRCKHTHCMALIKTK